MTALRNTMAAILSTWLLTGSSILAGEEKEANARAPTQARIDDAIARGVEFLRQEQRADGSFSRDEGMTGLAMFALAHSGVSRDDPAMVRGLRALRAGLAKPDTYGTSLAIMALNTLDRERNVKLIRRLADLLARGQCENGQWSYQLRPGRSAGDNSNTQFAVLALWCARRAGAEVGEKVFLRCQEFFEETQNEDGGWGYSARERKSSYGSMVATGLAALIISRAGALGVKLSDESARRTPEVRRAADWITRSFSVDRNPGASFKLGAGMRGVPKEVKDSFWHHYWLWSLERAAALAGIERFGENDWYDQGARRLLATQRKDGSWVGSEAPIPSTCFALLFLSRSTAREVATEAKEDRGTSTPVPR